MIGIYVKIWHSLPVEAVIVWFLAPIATVVTFDAFKRFFRAAAKQRAPRQRWSSVRRQ